MAKTVKTDGDERLPSAPAKTPKTGSRSSAGKSASGAAADAKKQKSGRQTVNAVPESSKMIHQFMPYVLIVAMIFLSACFICAGLDGAVGSVGKALRNVFCGAFGFSAFFTPLILLNLAVYWRKYVDMKMVAWKLGLSLVTLIFTAALFHVCSIPKLHGAAAYTWSVYGKSIFGYGDAVSNWANGEIIRGGGFFGGLIGGFFRCTVGYVGSMILLIAAIAVCLMFLFSVTPGYVWSRIRAEIANLREKRLARKEAVAEEEERRRKIADEAVERERRLQQAARARSAAASNAIDVNPTTVQEVPYVSGVLEGSGRTRDWSPAAAGYRAGAANDARVPGKGEKKPPIGSDGAEIPTIIPPSVKNTEQQASSQSAEPAQQAKEAAPAAQPASPAPAQPSQPETPAAPAREDSVKVLEEVLSGTTAAPRMNGDVSRVRRRAENAAARTDRPDADAPAGPKPAAQNASAPSAGGIPITPADGHAKSQSLPDILKKMVPANPAAISDEAEPDTDVSVSDAEKTSEEKLQAYFFPPIELLHEVKAPSQEDIAAELRSNAQKIMDKLSAFNVGIKKIEYSRGPTITRYELYPEANTRVRSIAGLADDIALELAATIRMEAPIPNKNAVGVEVPNQVRALVPIRELIGSEKFKSMNGRLSACLGKDVGGNMVFFDVGKMPHLLIAGTTGSGKSVCLNTIIMSLLYKARPDEVQFIMIDPKKIEMSMYNNLPHLKVPVVTDMKRAAGTLNAAVNEMEHRYELFEDCGSRDLDNYNKYMLEEDPGFVPLPRLVIIIDELADLMMSAPQQIESSIIRLAQKARAAGIHLIIGTQRPSVNVITGLIKANVPSRIAFSVVSNVESRIIIDIAGAEKLIGKGDMLFAPIGSSKPARIQGAFVDDDEVRSVTEFIKANSSPVVYDDEFISDIDRETDRLAAQENHGKSGDEEPAEFVQDADPLFNNALHVAVENGTVATSSLQRRLSIGFGRAAKIIDRMEALGFVSPANGTKPRSVMLTKQQLSELEAASDCRVQGRFN